jgi:hypothetical protein
MNYQFGQTKRIILSEKTKDRYYSPIRQIHESLDIASEQPRLIFQQPLKWPIWGHVITIFSGV